MLVIETAALVRLARKPLLTAEFPFLKAGRALSPSCGCGKTPVNANDIKAQIAGLSPTARERFKKLAGTLKVRVYYRDGNRTREVTF